MKDCMEEEIIYFFVAIKGCAILEVPLINERVSRFV